MTCNKDELELRLANSMAPMLLTVSIFSMTLVGSIPQPQKTIVDEILCIVSVICILGATMVIDSALDKANLSLGDRFKFLGGGYVLFCAVAGVMSTVIPLLYVSKSFPEHPVNILQYIVYFFAGVSVSAKLMQNKETAWTVAMFLLAVASLVVTAAL